MKKNLALMTLLSVTALSGVSSHVWGMEGKDDAYQGKKQDEKKMLLAAYKEFYEFGRPGELRWFYRDIPDFVDRFLNVYGNVFSDELKAKFKTLKDEANTFIEKRNALKANSKKDEKQEKQTDEKNEKKEYNKMADSGPLQQQLTFTQRLFQEFLEKKKIEVGQIEEVVDNKNAVIEFLLEHLSTCQGNGRRVGNMTEAEIAREVYSLSREKDLNPNTLNEDLLKKKLTKINPEIIEQEKKRIIEDLKKIREEDEKISALLDQ